MAHPKSKCSRRLLITSKPAVAAPSRLDANLIMEVERARYRQPEFSDSHWANLLLASYRAACQNSHTGLIPVLEDILRTFCVNAKAAKRKAAEYEAKGAPLPTWIKLPPPDRWHDVCREIQHRGILFSPTGDFLGLARDGD